MGGVKILWVDDEIELLKPHILFLRQKGYEVETLGNGFDALDVVGEEHFDLIILDEMMPGITGLETLARLKEINPTIPVVMVTKSEQESIMDRAVGSKIADYLIKPVNPNQVLLSIKKNVHQQQLVTEQTTSDYRSQFGQITNSVGSASTFDDWQGIYKKIVNWDIELGSSFDRSVGEILQYQKNEANSEFAKFVKRNYLDWFDDRNSSRPVLSHTVLREKLFPVMDRSRKTTLFLIDNFRYDQWLAVRSLLLPYFEVEKEDFYCSILPTATQYARNALFAGLTPLAISKVVPDLWVNENESDGKNKYEHELLQRQLKQYGKERKLSFDKLVRPEAGKQLLDNMDRVYSADLSVIVYNFLDILSHARTETEIIRELAEDEAAFRSLTRSWFEHSDLFEMIRRVAAKGHNVVITSDHGTKRVDNPIRVIGDRETSTNLRYKMGRNLDYNPKHVFAIDRPEQAHLPKINITSRYIFATSGDFLVYPNNYNHFVRYYKNTFQHGGISMEEMIVPFITLNPK
ncbi:MAG: bifunctional response regulator/alkaline phosphatase family protein [Rikenellaceae bacterium]